MPDYVVAQECWIGRPGAMTVVPPGRPLTLPDVEGRYLADQGVVVEAGTPQAGELERGAAPRQEAAQGEAAGPGATSAQPGTAQGAQPAAVVEAQQQAAAQARDALAAEAERGGQAAASPPAPAAPEARPRRGGAA
jgi:hypothetical protein